MILQDGLDLVGVDSPDEDAAVGPSDRDVAAVGAEARPRPVAADLEAVARERADDGVHAQVQQLEGVVPDAGQQVVGVSRQVQGSHLALEEDVVGRGVRPDVPEPDALVEVAADDGGPGVVAGHQVVAAAAGELGLDACASLSQLIAT